MNLNKSIYLIILLNLSILSFPNQVLSQSATNENSVAVFNSDTRMVFKLNGYWETSIEGDDFISYYFPNVFYNCKEVRIRKSIHLDKQLIPNSVWHLYFLGVNDEIEIYWNDQFVGKYISDGSPLWITLPRKINLRENNRLEFVVKRATPLVFQIRKNYLYYQKIATGIPRDFFLIRTSVVWLNVSSLKSEFESLNKTTLKAKINVSSFEIENLLRLGGISSQTSPYVALNAEIFLKYQTTKQVVAQTSTSINLSSFRNVYLEPSLVVISPLLWEPDNPNLYELEVRLTCSGVTIDNLRQDIGLAKWDTYKIKETTNFLLNGKPFIFKGVDYIEDFYSGSTEATLKKIESDLKILKSLGANAVRYIFTPPNPYLLQLANKMGMLVLTDLPAHFIPASILKKSDLFVRLQTITDNITRNCGTNPSLFAIGIADGLDYSNSIVTEYIHKMTKWIDNYPQVRKYATVVIGQKPSSLESLDFLIAKDNVSITEYENILNYLKKFCATTKIPVLYNFGTIIDPNNHKGYNDIMSLEYQAYYLNSRYLLRNQIGNAGVLYWSYNDYFTENPLGKSAINEPFVCYSGIIGNKSQRLSFNMLKALFNNEETPVINPGQVEPDFPVIYLIAGGFAFLLWGILINRSRRFREHTFRSLFRTYNFFADIRDRRLISNFQTGVFGITLSTILALYLASILSYWKTNESIHHLLNLLLVNDFIKEWTYRFSWKVDYFIIILTILIFIKINILALLLKVASLFVRSKIFLSDTFKMVIWSGAPLLFFLPISIFINRLLPISPILANVSNFLLILFLLLWLQRLLKSIWIVFDVRPSKVYAVSLFVLFFVCTAYFSYIQYKFSFFEYVSQYLRLYFL